MPVRFSLLDGFQRQHIERPQWRRCRSRVVAAPVATFIVGGLLRVAHLHTSLAFEAQGMPGQAPVRLRPLSGELEASSEAGAWLPDPIAYKAVLERGGREAREARLFGWGELLGTWMDHLLTAIDVAVLGDRVPTVLGMVDRNCAMSLRQVEALKRFKCGVRDAVRVFVLYLHEFDWLFRALEVKELPHLVLFGPGAGAGEGRLDLAGPLQPAEVVMTFSEHLSVELAWADFDEDPEKVDRDSSWHRRLLHHLQRLSLL